MHPWLLSLKKLSFDRYKYKYSDLTVEAYGKNHFLWGGVFRISIMDVHCTVEMEDHTKIRW